MLPEELIIEIRNADGTREGQLLSQDFDDVLVVPRLNDVGDWSLNLPATIIDKDGRRRPHRLCAALRAPGAGIIVSGPDGRILSGLSDEPSFSANQKNPDGIWSFSGVSDLVHLEDELAYGDPSKYDPNAQANSNDTRTGPAETVALEYIKRNIGQLAVAERRRAIMTVAASLGRGPTITKSPRFQNLLELVQEILSGTRLAIHALHSGSALEVSITEGRDLQKLVRFDFDNGQVSKTEYSYSGPQLTDVIVAGKGEGTDRKMVRRSVPAEGWGRRIERFVDQRNTDVVAELNQAGDEELQEATEKRTAFQIVPNTNLIRTTEGGLRLGDLVSVVVHGDEIPVPITSLPISAGPDGVFIGATVGSPVGRAWEDRVDIRQQRTERRLSNIERSQ